MNYGAQKLPENILKEMLDLSIFKMYYVWYFKGEIIMYGFFSKVLVREIKTKGW